MNTKTQLQQLYHTLTLIETKGENTLMMAACLTTLQQILTEMSQSETDHAAPPIENEVNHAQ